MMRRVEGEPVQSESELTNKTAANQDSKVIYDIDGLTVHTEYEYEDNDINTLLEISVQELQVSPDRANCVLGAVDNIRSKGVQRSLNDCLNSLNKGKAYNLLLPYNLGNYHWCAIFISLNPNLQPITIYYCDPLGNVTSVPRIILTSVSQIWPELKDLTVVPIQLLVQPDVKSCGVLVVENLMLLAQNMQQHKLVSIPELAIIRRNHLIKLHEKRQKYFELFYPRQKENRATVIDIPQQVKLLSQGVKFSALEWKRIIIGYRILRSFENENIRVILEQSLSYKQEYQTNVQLHLQAIKSGLKKIFSMYKNTDELAKLASLIDLFFNIELEDYELTEIDNWDYCITYEEIKLLDRFFKNEEIIDLDDFPQLVAEQIKSDEEYARQLQEEEYARLTTSKEISALQSDNRAEQFAENSSPLLTEEDNSITLNIDAYNELIKNARATIGLLPLHRTTIKNVAGQFVELGLPDTDDCFYYGVILGYLLPVINQQEQFTKRGQKLFTDKISNQELGLLNEKLREYNGNIELLHQSNSIIRNLIDRYLQPLLREYISQHKKDLDPRHRERLAALMHLPIYGMHSLIRSEISALSDMLQQPIKVYISSTAQFAADTSEVWRDKKPRLEPIYLIKLSSTRYNLCLNTTVLVNCNAKNRMQNDMQNESTLVSSTAVLGINLFSSLFKGFNSEIPEKLAKVAQIFGKTKYEISDLQIVNRVNMLAEEALKNLKENYLSYRYIKPLFGEAFDIMESDINLTLLDRETEENKPELVPAESPVQHEDQTKWNFALPYAEQQNTVKTSSSVEAENLFKSNPRQQQIVILGQAGSGKTTYITGLTVRWALGTLWQDEFDWVFKIYCDHLNQSPVYQPGKNYTIQDLIHYECFPEFTEKKFEELWEGVIAHVQSERILIIMDGLEKLLGIHSNPKHPLHNLMQHLLISKRPILATLRPYGMAIFMQPWREIKLIGFNDDAVKTYIKFYFNLLSKKTKSIEADILDKKSESLLLDLQRDQNFWSVAHNPITLNVICGLSLQHQDTGLTDQTHTQLYQKIEDQLLINAYRENQADTPVKLSADEILKILREEYNQSIDFLHYLAYTGLVHKSSILDKDLIDDALNWTLSLEKNIKASELAQRKNQLFETALKWGLIRPILKQDSHIKIEREKAHEFIHDNFHDYLAASFMSKSLCKSDHPCHRQIKIFIRINKFDQRYQFVILFIAGMLRNQPEALKTFLELLQEEVTEDLTNDYQLGLLVRCYEESYHSSTREQFTLILEKIISRLQWWGHLNHQQMCLIENKKSLFLNAIALSPKLRILLSEKIESMSFFPGCQSIYNLCALLTTIKVPLFQELINSLRQQLISVEKSESKNQYLSMQLTEDTKEVYRIMQLLGEMAGVPEILVVLANQLKSPIETVCYMAAGSIFRIGKRAATPQIIKTLFDILNNSKGQVWIAALNILQKFRNNEIQFQVSDVLIKLLKHKNDEFRKLVVIQMGIFYELASEPKMIKAIIANLTHPSPNIRIEAAKILHGWGDKGATTEVLTAVKENLKNPSYEVRKEVCEALAQMGNRAISLLPTLEVCYKEADVNNLSIYGLAILGVLRNKDASQFLLNTIEEFLCHTNPKYRVSAFALLYHMKGKRSTPKILSAIIANINYPHEMVNRGVSCACETLRQQAIAVIPALVERLKQVDRQNVKEIDTIITVIGAFSDKAARLDVVSALEPFLMSQNIELLTTVLWALNKIGKAAKSNQVLTVLLVMLNDRNLSRKIRLTVAEILIKMDIEVADEGILAILIECLHDYDQSFVAGRAYFLLVKMGAKVATPHILRILVSYLNDEDMGVRVTVMDILGALGDKAFNPEVITALLANLTEKAWDIAGYSAQTLGKLGERAAEPRVLTKLIQLLREYKNGGIVSVNTFGEEGLFRSKKRLDIDCVLEVILNTLGEMGKGAATYEVLVTLLSYIKSDNISESKRAAAICAISKIVKDSISRLIQLLAETASNKEIYTVLNALVYAALYNGGSLQIVYKQNNRNFYLISYFGDQISQVSLSDYQSQIIKRLIPVVTRIIDEASYLQPFRFAVQTIPVLQQDPLLGHMKENPYPAADDLIQHQNDEQYMATSLEMQNKAKPVPADFLYLNRVPIPVIELQKIESGLYPVKAMNAFSEIVNIVRGRATHDIDQALIINTLTRLTPINIGYQAEVDNEQLSVVHYCAFKGLYKAYYYIIDRLGFPPNKMMTRGGLYPIHIAIISRQIDFVRSHLEYIKKLTPVAIDNGTQIHELHLAILENSPAMVSAILDNVRLENPLLSKGGTFLHLVIACSNENDMLEILLNHRYRADNSVRSILNVEYENKTVLGYAAYLGHVAQVDYLYNLLSWNLEIQKGLKDVERAFYHAAKAGRVEVVRYFLDKGFQPRSDHDDYDDTITYLKSKSDDNFQSILGLMNNARQMGKLQRNNPPNPLTQEYESIVYEGSGMVGAIFSYMRTALIKCCQKRFVDVKTKKGYEDEKDKRLLADKCKRVAGASTSGIFALLHAMDVPEERIERAMSQNFSQFLEDYSDRAIAILDNPTYIERIMAILQGLANNTAEQIAVVKQIQSQPTASGSMMSSAFNVAASGYSIYKAFLEAIKDLTQLNSEFKGFVKGVELINWLTKLVKAERFSEVLTFGEWADIVNGNRNRYKHLYIAITCLETGLPIILSSENPVCSNYVILSAIHAAFSVPVVFEPVKLRIKISEGKFAYTTEHYIGGNLLCKNLTTEFDKRLYTDTGADGDKDYPSFNAKTIAIRFRYNRLQLSQGIDFNKNLQQLCQIFNQAENIISAYSQQNYHRSIELESDTVSALTFRELILKDKNILGKISNETVCRYFGYSVNEVFADEITTLMEAARQGDVEQLQRLLEAGLDVNLVDHKEQATLLHWAAGFGHIHAVELLLQVGANPHLKDANGELPLDWVLEENQNIKKLLQSAMSLPATPQAANMNMGFLLNQPLPQPAAAISYGSPEILNPNSK